MEEGADPLPQLEALGNIAFDEGATDIETFTERMKAKLGELYERFKDFIQTVFDKLKSERGSIEFGRDVPLFPELQLSDALKPFYLRSASSQNDRTAGRAEVRIVQYH